MKNWLITGVSSGLGRALAEEVLAVGDTVVGTVRSDEDLAIFEKLHPEHAIGRILDVTDHEKIPQVVQQAEESTGGLDVLVNNAGYGLLGAVEEVSLDELRRLFEVNFFGAFSCIQAVLPAFRSRRSGHIVNITSVSGLAPWGGTAAYGASKYALECVGQTLAQEMSEFGVKVTNIEPGGIDTEFGGRSLSTSELEIDAYRGTAAHFPRQVYTDTHRPPGNATKAAKAIIQVVASDNPPLQLLLGEDAVHYAGQQLTSFIEDMTTWMPLTMSIKN